MTKKLHWTQRPENRARVVALAKKRHAKRPMTSRSPKRETPDATDLHAEETAYAFGFTQSWLYAYAERTGIARQTLAYRVGKLLQAAPGR